MAWPKFNVKNNACETVCKNVIEFDKSSKKEIIIIAKFQCHSKVSMFHPIPMEITQSCRTGSESLF
jgi:hypothetical protein